MASDHTAEPVLNPGLPGAPSQSTGLLGFCSDRKSFVAFKLDFNFALRHLNSSRNESSLFSHEFLSKGLIAVPKGRKRSVCSFNKYLSSNILLGATVVSSNDVQTGHMS